MRKPGTQVPARRSVCIVFGAAKGQKYPKAGIFSDQNSAHAAELAARAGLMTLKVSRSALPRLRDRLLEGDISAKGQLQLHAIHRDMLAELRGQYASQANQPTKGASGGSAGPPPKPANGVSPTSAAP